MFRRLWVQITALYTGWTFFTLICCKNCIVCSENKRKRGQGWPILQKDCELILRIFSIQVDLAKAVEGLKKEIGTFRIGVALPKNLRVTKNVERGREKEREREREREEPKQFLGPASRKVKMGKMLFTTFLRQLFWDEKNIFFVVAQFSTNL